MATTPATTECHLMQPIAKSTTAQIEKKTSAVGRFICTTLSSTLRNAEHRCREQGLSPAISLWDRWWEADFSTVIDTQKYIKRFREIRSICRLGCSGSFELKPVATTRIWSVEATSNWASSASSNHRRWRTSMTGGIRVLSC